MTSVVIVNGVSAYREAIAIAVNDQDAISVVGTAGTQEEALATVQNLKPDVVLVDAGMPESMSTIRAIARLDPDIKVVALALPENENVIIAYAKAGIVGYVTLDASIQQLVQAVLGAVRGELRCSPRIAGTLLRSVAAVATEHWPPPLNFELTARETEILELIDQGLSNKEIAARLGVEVSTVKNHVHSILKKLRVRRRSQAAARLRSGVEEGLVDEKN